MKTQKQVVDYIKSLEGKGWDWDNAFGLTIAQPK